MNENDFRDILQSDMKLWDYAEDTEVTGDSVTKVLEIPWGIGRTEVKLEGLKDGNARRGALAGYGQHIRSLVDNRVGDESVTARAQQSAARSSDNDGGVYAGDAALSEREEVPDTRAVATHDEVTSGPEAVANRFIAVEDEIARVEGQLESLRRERAGLRAYLTAMGDDDAPTDTKTPEINPA